MVVKRERWEAVEGEEEGGREGRQLKERRWEGERGG